MKEVMARLGGAAIDDSPRFEFHQTPRAAIQPGLFDELFAQQRINELERMLLAHFRGRTVKFIKVYEEHEISQSGTAYLKDDYKHAIGNLETKHLVELDVSRERRMRKGKVTVGDDRIIQFLDQRL